MLLESAANRRNPVVELTIDDVRQVLSVPDGKLSRWVDLNRFAIEPAIRQINDNATAAGFSVDVETVMQGRKVERVRFKVGKAALRLADEDALRLRISHRSGSEAESPASVPVYDIDAALTIIRREARGLDAQAILQEFASWVKGTDQPIKSPLGLLTQFARRKAKEYRLDLFNHESE